jgi:tRNA(His) 5'-end guanylyltransferase
MDAKTKYQTAGAPPRGKGGRADKTGRKRDGRTADPLGDRIKGYEAREGDRRAMRGLPVVARLDGRAFSRFTRGMARPFDQDFADLMVETTKYLVEQTQAAVGYTQSDEISLVIDPFRAPDAAEVLRALELRLVALESEPGDIDARMAEAGWDEAPDPDDADCPEYLDRREAEEGAAGRRLALAQRMRGWIGDIRRGCPVPEQAVDFMFGGRFQKLVSVMAGMATARFVSDAVRLWPDRCARQLPVFDCRVFEVPSREEAVAALVWRELDATKNAVSMAARAHFSHSALDGKSSAEMQEMLFREAGVNFNDYPPRFKRGVYVRRTTVLREFDGDTLSRIPAGRRPDGPVARRETVVLDLPPIGKVSNRVAVLLDGAEPIRAA